MLAGNTGLSEWLKDPSYANINLSRNKIHGEAKNRKNFVHSLLYSTVAYVVRSLQEMAQYRLLSPNLPPTMLQLVT